jgi:hypothetical protein
MEPENLDIEQINEDRRKAIQQNIETIHIDDLKALGEKLFPYPITPGGRSFSLSSSSSPATHAIMPPQTMESKSFIVPRLKKGCGTQRQEGWDHCQPRRLLQ